MSLFLVLAGVAILAMLWATYKVFALRHRIPGGHAKRRWNLLAALVGFFLLAYLALPLFPSLPSAVRDLGVAAVFLGGALFVILVVDLFDRIITDLGL